jgi:hypothetical protein
MVTDLATGDVADPAAGHRDRIERETRRFA